VDRWPENDAKNRAYKVFRQLDALDPQKLETLAVKTKKVSLP
jgi:hypothetical protein